MRRWLSTKPESSSAQQQPGEIYDEPQTQTPASSTTPSRSNTRSPRTSLTPVYSNPYNYAGQPYSQDGYNNAYSTGVSRPSDTHGSNPNIKTAKKDKDKGKEKEKERDHERGPYESLTTPHDAFIADLYGFNNNNNTSTSVLQPSPVISAPDRKVSADQESFAWDNTIPSSPPRLSIIPPSLGTTAAPAIAISHSSSRNELVLPLPIGLISSGASHLSSATGGTTRLSTPVDLLFDPYDGTVLGSLVPQLPDNEDENHTDDLHTMALAGAGIPGIRAPSELVWSHLSKVLELENDISRLHMRMENIGTKEAAAGRKATKKGHQRTPSGRGSVKVDVGGDADSLNTLGGSDKIPSSVDTPTLARSMGPRAKDKERYASSLPRGMRRSRGMSTVSDVSEHSSDADDVGNVNNAMDDGGLDMPTEEAEAKRLREEEFAKLARQFAGRKEAIHEIMDKVDSLSKAITDFHKLHFGFPNSPQPSMTGFSTPVPPMTESLSDTMHLTNKNPVTQLSEPVPGNGGSGFKTYGSSPDRSPMISPKTAPAHIQINPMVMGRARSDGAAMGTPVLPPSPYMMPKLGTGRAAAHVEGEASARQAQTRTDQNQSRIGEQDKEGTSQAERVRQKKQGVPMLLINSLELDSNISKQEHLMDSPASTFGSLKSHDD